MPQHATKTSWLPGVSGNPLGRPAGSKNKLSHLEPKAIQAIENNLDSDNMAAAMYVYDRINGKEPAQLTVNLPEMKTLLEILQRHPAALRDVEAKFLPEESDDAIPSDDPGA